MTWFGPHTPFFHDPRSAENAFVITAACIAYGLTLALNAVTARFLPPAAYGEFSSAVALASIICTCATLGLEKYALRLIPEYLRNHRSAKVKGYILFGMLVTVLVGAALGFGGFAVYGTYKPHAENLSVLEQMLWFVPAIALFFFLVEIATTFRNSVGPTMVYRLVLPAITLVAMVAVSRMAAQFTVSDAVDVYGVSWIVGLVVLAVYAVVAAPRELHDPGVSVEPRQWITNGIGFLGLSLLLTLFAQSTILILEVLKGDRAGVAMLSAALQISGLAILLQTATLRVFAPELARRIAAGDVQGQWALIRKRGRVMLMVGIPFTAGIIVFGHELLGLFGAEYKSAYPTLIVLTVGNVVNIFLGAAPVFLQFHGRHRLTLALAAAGTVVTFATIAVASEVGTYETVAQAYTCALIALYIVLHIVARRVWRGLARASAT